MQLYPYLTFNGNADEAMHFYQKVLGGKLSISRFSDLPDFDPETSGLETAQRVLNAQLQWDHAVFMASDTCPEQPSEPMQSV
ncbi:MAG TPA: VOC family protein, partial [Paenalcaligenes sp.]|nr:VOC family protein [Paenalcaligenes sp.]